MVMTFSYDFMVAGATGQIGNLLVENLETFGTVYRLSRTSRVFPLVKHVVNAGGFTKFNNDVGSYWEDNLRLSIRLATHAKDTGARYHQLSSEAVAEYRSDVLPETVEGPIANPRMIDYALSKVMVELAVRTIVPAHRLSIYRCSDVVPPVGRLAEQWRRDHWLAILFGAGKEGFRPVDDFPVWIAHVDDMARALSILIRYPGTGAYHLLGRIHRWREFHEQAVDLSRPSALSRLVPKVEEVIRISPPLATCIDQATTSHTLKTLGFTWADRSVDYWREFATMAVRPREGFGI
jgi:nucleoside-diphosphate-sugar epimerase